MKASEDLKRSPLQKSLQRAEAVPIRQSFRDTKHIAPLFADEKEYEAFCARHDRDKIRRKDISTASGPVFLGIDAGSTTTKAALIDEDKNLLYSYYVRQ